MDSASLGAKSDCLMLVVDGRLASVHVPRVAYGQSYGDRCSRLQQTEGRDPEWNEEARKPSRLKPDRNQHDVKYQANGEGGEASDEVVPAPLGSNIRYVHGWPRDPVVD
jgi:hypothetical protein